MEENVKDNFYSNLEYSLNSTLKEEFEFIARRYLNGMQKEMEKRAAEIVSGFALQIAKRLEINTDKAVFNISLTVPEEYKDK